MINDARDLATFKNRLYAAVCSRFHDSVKSFKDLIADLQQSANEETKTSVGDKYETGRAMVQLEIEKVTAQLAVLSQSQNALKAGAPGTPHHVIQLGTLFQTPHGWFYILFSGGEIVVDGMKIHCISIQSPMARAVFGKSANAVVEVNGRPTKILQVA